jgi:hypothetical protein
LHLCFYNTNKFCHAIIGAHIRVFIAYPSGFLIAQIWTINEEDISFELVRIGYAAFQLCGGGCVLKKEVATPSSVVFVEPVFVCISLQAASHLQAMEVGAC